MITSEQVSKLKAAETEMLYPLGELVPDKIWDRESQIGSLERLDLHGIRGLGKLSYELRIPALPHIQEGDFGLVVDDFLTSLTIQEKLGVIDYVGLDQEHGEEISTAAFRLRPKSNKQALDGRTPCEGEEGPTLADALACAVHYPHLFIGRAVILANQKANTLLLTREGDRLLILPAMYEQRFGKVAVLKKVLAITE